MKADETSDYLVISRGQWEKDASVEDIQQAIDEFYVWLADAIEAGRMKMGSRLSVGGATVARSGTITDGPFGEAKEAVGGYWFIVARSLDEAAAIAAENPCMRYGLFYEIRPLEPSCASAAAVTTENLSKSESQPHTKQ